MGWATRWSIGYGITAAIFYSVASVIGQPLTLALIYSAFGSFVIWAIIFRIRNGFWWRSRLDIEEPDEFDLATGKEKALWFAVAAFAAFCFYGIAAF